MMHAARAMLLALTVLLVGCSTAQPVPTAAPAPSRQPAEEPTSGPATAGPTPGSAPTPVNVRAVATAYPTNAEGLTLAGPSWEEDCRNLQETYDASQDDFVAGRLRARQCPGWD
jgi:hypothetical protein